MRTRYMALENEQLAMAENVANVLEHFSQDITVEEIKEHGIIIGFPACIDMTNAFNYVSGILDGLVCANVDDMKS